VLEDIERSVTYSEHSRELSNPLLQKIARATATATLNKRFEQLGRTAEGVSLVWRELSVLFEIIRNQFAQPLGPFHFRIQEATNRTKTFDCSLGANHGLTVSRWR
jgi:hypothetical protein